MIKIKFIGLIAIILAMFTMCCESPSSNSSTTTTTTTTTTTAVAHSTEAVVELDDPNGAISVASNFYFVFDVSGSMNDGCSGSTKIKGAKKALLSFIEKVPGDANIGLLLFGVNNGNGVKEVLPLGPYTANKDEFIRIIKKLSCNGSTPLAKATSAATNKLIAQYKRQLTYGEYRMIIVSDGDANSNGDYKKALNYAAKYPFISIYGISLCMGGDNILAKYAVSFADASNYDELEKALEQSVAELPTFDPTDFDFDELSAEQNN